MKRIISILLIFCLLLPVLVTSVIPLAYSAGEDNSTDESEVPWLKGILLILISFLINGYQEENKVEEEQPEQLPEQPQLEDNINRLNSPEILGFYVNWLTQYTSSYQSLEDNSGTIDMVAPFWYTLDPDGEIKSRYGGHQYEVASLSERENIKVLPLINNNQQNNMILIDPEIRDKAINNIVDLVRNNNYAGVNIDFEFLPPWTRDGYTAFIRKLSEKLRSHNKLLTISVFPKIEVPLNLQEAYDYSSLALLVDRIVIMTYDHHWSSGPAGPIAPIDWVEENIKYALEYIPRDKLLLGIANYGYDWTGDGLGENLSTKAALDISSKNEITIQWDQQSKVPYFHYQDARGIKHEVWFENSYSLEHKLDLVNKYNLRGIAIWRLGNERERFWEIVREKLKGN